MQKNLPSLYDMPANMVTIGANVRRVDQINLTKRQRATRKHAKWLGDHAKLVAKCERDGWIGLTCSTCKWSEAELIGLFFHGYTSKK